MRHSRSPHLVHGVGQLLLGLEPDGGHVVGQALPGPGVRLRADGRVVPRVDLHCAGRRHRTVACTAVGAAVSRGGVPLFLIRRTLMAALVRKKVFAILSRKESGSRLTCP